MTDDTWTPLIGLRRALIHVAVRIPLMMAGWALLLWLAAPVLDWLPLSMWVFPLVSLVMIWPGMAIGRGLSQGVTDSAGMAGWPLTVIAIAGACVSIWAGAEIALLFRAIGDWQVFLANASAIASGSVLAVMATAFED